MPTNSTYVMGVVQYTPGSDSVLIPLRLVAPIERALQHGGPIACHASQSGLASLTPNELSDRSRWSDEETRAYATAFVRRWDADAVVLTESEWAEVVDARSVGIPPEDAVADAAVIESEVLSEVLSAVGEARP